jgi:cytoskeletal protein RodZ
MLLATHENKTNYTRSIPHKTTLPPSPLVNHTVSTVSSLFQPPTISVKSNLKMHHHSILLFALYGLLAPLVSSIPSASNIIIPVGSIITAPAFPTAQLDNMPNSISPSPFFPFTTPPPHASLTHPVPSTTTLPSSTHALSTPTSTPKPKITSSAEAMSSIAMNMNTTTTMKMSMTTSPTMTMTMGVGGKNSSVPVTGAAGKGKDVRAVSIFFSLDE